MTEENIRTIVKVLSSLCLLGLGLYHYWKIRRQGKAEFDRMMILTIKSGLIGLFVFLAAAVFYWWLNNITPPWQAWFRTGLFGSVLGIGVGMLRDIRNKDHRNQKKRLT